jgi:hypothetical protein
MRACMCERMCVHACGFLGPSLAVLERVALQSSSHIRWLPLLIRHYRRGRDFKSFIPWHHFHRSLRLERWKGRRSCFTA